MIIERIIADDRIFFTPVFLEKAIQRFKAKKVEISKSGSEGGYLSRHSVRGFRDSMLVFQGLIKVGTFSYEKASKYLNGSIEKPTRLHLHLKDGHKTSRQSVDLKNGEPPGAVLIGSDDIYSFAGIEPQFDEFMSVFQSLIDSYAENIGSPDQRSFPMIVQRHIKRLDLITAAKEERFAMYEVIEELSDDINTNAPILYKKTIA